jgi:putative membrane protein
MFIGLIVVFMVGLLLHGIKVFRPCAVQITEGFLFIINFVILIIYAFKVRSVKFAIIALTIFLLTFGIEVLGVKTGRIFGPYQYGQTFKIGLFDVPMVIGFNWLMLILSSTALVKSWVGSSVISAILSALILVLLDFLLEPIAIELDYWRWTGNQIPIQNYIAWFFIGLAFSAWVRPLMQNSLLLKSYVIIQLAYFAGIAIII